MNKEEVIATLLQHEGAMRRLGVKSLALFGSVVRGEQHPKSDIDLLYEFEEQAATLDHYLDLQAFLEDLLGQKVDLVSRKYMSPILTRHIQGDIAPVLTG